MQKILASWGWREIQHALWSSYNVMSSSMALSTIFKSQNSPISLCAAAEDWSRVLLECFLSNGSEIWKCRKGKKIEEWSPKFGVDKPYSWDNLWPLGTLNSAWGKPTVFNDPLATRLLEFMLACRFYFNSPLLLNTLCFWLWLYIVITVQKVCCKEFIVLMFYMLYYGSHVFYK